MKNISVNRALRIAWSDMSNYRLKLGLMTLLTMIFPMGVIFLPFEGDLIFMYLGLFFLVMIGYSVWMGLFWPLVGLHVSRGLPLFVKTMFPTGGQVLNFIAVGLLLAAITVFPVIFLSVGVFYGVWLIEQAANVGQTSLYVFLLASMLVIELVPYYLIQRLRLIPYVVVEGVSDPLVVLAVSWRATERMVWKLVYFDAVVGVLGFLSVFSLGLGFLILLPYSKVVEARLYRMAVQELKSKNENTKA